MDRTPDTRPLGSDAFYEQDEQFRAARQRAYARWLTATSRGYESAYLGCLRTLIRDAESGRHPETLVVSLTDDREWHLRLERLKLPRAPERGTEEVVIDDAVRDEVLAGLSVEDRITLLTAAYGRYAWKLLLRPELWRLSPRASARDREECGDLLLEGYVMPESRALPVPGLPLEPVPVLQGQDQVAYVLPVLEALWRERRGKVLAMLARG